MDNLNYLLYGLGISNISIKKYFDLSNIKYDIFIDQKNKLEDINLSNYDYIIKSPGIKNNTQLLNEASNLGIKVISDLELYYLLFNKNKNIIAVTGSNGKTTTTSLIGNILKDYEVCGNIGVPLFDKINTNNLVIECSSYMLEKTEEFKPNIFVLLNILPHHLDHHETFENYIIAKTKVIENMSEDDIVIYNLDDEVISNIMKNKKVKKYTFSKTNNAANIYLKEDNIIFNNNIYLNINNLKIKDKQFIDDFLAAIIAGKIKLIEDELIINHLKSFQTLTHRFEYIVNKESLIIINDSKSTNPYSLKEGLINLTKKFYNYFKILILGGKIIKEDYSVLNDYLKGIDLIYLTGENRFILGNLFQCFNIKICSSLDEIVDLLPVKTSENTVILFSPASPSLDNYKSFEERGNYFKKLILNKYDIGNN